MREEDVHNATRLSDQVPEEVAIVDPEDAEDYISQLYERGERPVISVPKEYEAALRTGLRARASWITGLSLLVGTMGRNPYLPGSQDRVFARLKDISRSAIHARFTGPDKAFHGVIVLDGPIMSDQFEFA